MTSRNSQCGLLATIGGHEELDSLEESECVQLLQQTAKLSEVACETEDYALAVTLVRHLGHHTLAILHAGSYMATTHCTMSEYLDFLRTNRRRLLERSRGQGQSRYDTVYATFGASIEFLELSETGGSEETCKDSLQLLEVLSTFQNMSVPLDVLLDACEGVKIAIQNPEEETDLEVLTARHVARVPDFVRTENKDVKFRIVDAVVRLESLAMVRTDRSARAWKSVSMHPLVHGWLSDRQTQTERKEALRMTQCVVALSQFAFDGWRSYYYQLAPHLKQLVESSVTLVDDAAQCRYVLQLCVQIATMYIDMALHRESCEFTSRILQQLGLYDQLEQPTKEYRQLYNVFAMAVRDEGSRPAQALRQFEAIARLDEKTLGENDPDRLGNLNDLGDLYRENGKTKKAIALLWMVVKAWQELGEDYSGDLHTSQHDLASALLDDSQNKEAIMLLENVVIIKEKLLSEDDPDRRSSEQLLGIAYLWDRQFAEATRRFEDLVRTEVQTLGEENLQTAVTQNWLADAYLEAGRLSDAIALYERVVNTETLLLSETHPRLLTSQHELAEGYLHAGRVFEAIELLEQVVYIRNSTLDDTNQQRLKSQHELGRAYLQAEMAVEAIGIFERVVEVESLMYDQGHPARVVTQELLDEAYSIRDIYFPSSQSFPESGIAPPDPSLQPAEASDQAGSNDGPAVEVDGQRTETSSEVASSNSFISSVRPGRVGTRRKRSSESSDASDHRVKQCKDDQARMSR